MHCSLTRAALEEAPIDQKKSRRYVTRYPSFPFPKIFKEIQAMEKELKIAESVKSSTANKKL